MSLKKLFISFAVFLIIQPLALSAAEILPSPAHAQTTNNSNGSSSVLPGSPNETWDDNVNGDEDGASNTFINDDELTNQPGNTSVNTLDQLAAIANNAANEQLQISPQDLQQLKDDNVDIRTTDYLNYLVTPTVLGGAGLTHVGVSRIFKNYSTSGTGQYDQETLAAISQNDNTISTHARGEAVDISQVGAITCKLVVTTNELLGGNQTQTIWEPATSVQVAWQSTAGIAHDPTPTGASLIGASGSMTGQGLASFLNQTGQLNSTIDYSRGLDLNTLLTYAGGNVLLKDLGSTQVTSDPLAGNLLQTIGGAMLKQALPGLPDGVNIGNPNEDVRTSVAQSQIAQDLGLPAGSITGFGWDSILTSVGERQLESSLNLPTMYLYSHSLSDLNNNPTVSAELSSFQRADDSLNVPTGTVALIQQDNTQALKLAGVNVLASALKLTSDQKTALVNAVTKNQDPTPIINLNAVPTSDKVNSEYLTDMFSSNTQLQKTAQTDLQNFGTQILQSIENNNNALPSNLGLTQDLLKEITGSTPITLGSLETQIGTNNIASNAGLSDAQKADFTAGTANTGTNTQIANFINSEFQLSGSETINASDVQGIAQNGNNTILQKIGGAQADAAFDWSKGTGYQVMTGQTNFGTAMEQTFSNAVASMLDLKNPNVPLTGNIALNFGAAIISQRLGIPTSDILPSSNNTTDNVSNLEMSLGQNELYSLFNINSTEPLSQLENDSSYWSDPSNLSQSYLTDVNLGLPVGTTAQYMQGQLTTNTLSQTTASDNISSEVTPSKINSYFGLSGGLQLNSSTVSNIINVLAGKANASTISTIPIVGSSSGGTSLLAPIIQIVSNSVANKAGFSPSTLVGIAENPSAANTTQTLINQGAQLLVKGLGANIAGFNVSSVVNSLLQSYNQSLSSNTTTNNIGTPGISPINDVSQPFTSFITQASGIPIQYAQQDDNYFITGDFPTGMDIASFSVNENSVNPYLPASDQLTYQDQRNTLFPDQSTVNNNTSSILSSSGVTNPSASQQTNATAMGRKQAIDQAVQNASYKMSDGLLIKADPNIPAGFTEAMYNGTTQQKTQILQQFAVNSLASLVNQVNPSIRAAVTAALSGNGTSAQNTALNLAISQAGINLGPMNANDLVLFAQFQETPGANQTADYISPTFQPMWSSLNSWIGSTLNIPGLPSTFAQSLYFASQNNWNTGAQITNANGQVVVPSINSLGQTFVASQLSNWADQELHLPAGTVYRVYSSLQAIQKAETALQNAEATGSATQISQAQHNLSVSQAAMYYFVITTVLNSCSACQQFFGSVDQALGAPAGFTNALADGAIAYFLGLGPAGLYMAAAMLVLGYFGYGKTTTQYLCPTPPKDPYAITDLDPTGDQDNFGYAISDPTLPINSGPVSRATTPNGAETVVINGPNSSGAGSLGLGSITSGLGSSVPGLGSLTGGGGSSSPGSVSIYKAGSGTAIATITVGVTPAGVAITPDGSKAYVTNSGGNTVSVIDLSKNVVVANITVGSSPADVSVSTDGSIVYVTNSNSNTVSEISTATNAVTSTVTQPTSTYSNGNNSALWMAWARYYTGKLIDSTLVYGASHTNPYSLQQILTYREANAAYFEPLAANAFNDIPGTNPEVGVGFTQNSTKTTDWVYVAFGGIY